MPGKFLTDAQRYELTHFPTDISHEDISAYFTLTEDDKILVRKQHGPHNRLGFALQIGTLRYLGFFPDDLVTIPASVVNYVAAQLGVSSQELLNYGRRGQTRTDHIRHIEDYLRFQGVSEAVLKELSQWLVQRALEHDKPILLFQMASEKLYSMRIIRPGVTTLERLVIAARQLAQEETYQRLSSLITDDHQRLLDSILIPGETAEQPWPRRP